MSKWRQLFECSARLRTRRGGGYGKVRRREARPSREKHGPRPAKKGEKGRKARLSAGAARRRCCAPSSTAARTGCVRSRTKRRRPGNGASHARLSAPTARCLLTYGSRFPNAPRKCQTRRTPSPARRSDPPSAFCDHDGFSNFVVNI